MDNVGGERRVVPVTFVDVWILSPVIATFGAVALTLIGAVPLVLLKIIPALSSLVPEPQGPILAFATLIIAFAALLGGLWLGCRLALRLFNAATMMALLYWKGFSWREFRTAELRVQSHLSDRRRAG